MTEPRDEARDVLAAALDDREFRGAVNPDTRADALLRALAARGYRLAPEPAPDVELERLRRIETAARKYIERYPVGYINPEQATFTPVPELAALRAALHPADPSRTP